MFAFMNVGVRRGHSDDWPRRGTAVAASSCRLEGSLLPTEVVDKIGGWAVWREVCVEDIGPTA